jgi:hypothetical protein
MCRCGAENGLASRAVALCQSWPLIYTAGTGSMQNLLRYDHDAERANALHG